MANQCWDCGCDIEGEPGQVQCYSIDDGRPIFRRPCINTEGHFIANLHREMANGLERLRFPNPMTPIRFGGIYSQKPRWYTYL